MTPSNSTTTLHVRRFIPAPRARVFAAFVQPEDLVKWLGPGPCQCLEAKIEPRIGGVFDVHMRLTDGSEGYIRGKYLEVRPPDRLVFTWGWEGTPHCAPGTSQVSVDFVEIDNGTDVQLTHERLANPVERDNHAHGWAGCFDKLAKFFSPAAAEPAPPTPPGEFSWNELLTSDVDVAGKFYTQLFGWTTAPFPGPVPYTLFRQGEKGVGGMMPQQQPGTPPIWLSYISVADCNASAAKAEKLGAKICLPPKDIPTIGRIAVITDPLGTPFGIFQPEAKG
jgi:uncharacterized protein YndB with AHSA1/START domain/predicted enzyme related to lactoylglutathione lyase